MPTPVVTNGAVLQCTFGVAPCPLVVLPENRVTAGALPVATIMDNIPLLNVTSFAMCTSPTNPEVIALTAAALGVPTPAPCIPVLSTPWEPGVPTVSVAGLPVLDANCKLMCDWEGVIGVDTPAQVTVTVP
jgi:hypothetical protein